ncbi:hypothetical protein [Sphingomonas bacterium]|uniref:hypothetical protein n=1 Tax=Sphingomonas bacterium TaxID=1895847 RepID=UPI0015776FAC|nr:hypothetical protein [Sphingomonas bacterium]
MLWKSLFFPVALACVAVGLTATPALASTQGTLGATSTGNITITVTVPNRVQITGLNDVAFTNVDPSTTATNAQSNCVWSNTATKGYTITATGSGTSGAFTLASGALTPVAYSVQWNQSTGQSSGTALTAATASSTFNSTATTPTCATAPATSSSLIVSITSAQLLTMASQTSYTGTLTLLVSPV